MPQMKGHVSERVPRSRSTATSHCSIIYLLRLNRSVVGGILNASSWPTILRTDTAATTRVDKRVVLISIFSTAGLILLAAVSIITPLGLYENITHGSHEEVEFGYAPDLQPIGRGTPQRTDYNVSRLCGQGLLIDCPVNTMVASTSPSILATFPHMMIMLGYLPWFHLTLLKSSRADQKVTET